MEGMERGMKGEEGRRRDGEDRRLDRSRGKKELDGTVRPLTSSACLTKGKRPQYLRVVSTHGVHQQRPRGPHKSYKAEPLRERFPFLHFFLSYSFSIFFLAAFPHSFRGANALSIVTENTRESHK